MMSTPARCLSTFASAAMLTLLALSGPALAQYKVVLPDGSTTYTDRPPITDTAARITPLRRNGSVAPTDAALPIDLRQAMQRYPVTLYTAPDCTPCDNGRRYLQARGVPFSEKRVSTEEDAIALDRLVGGRTVPALTVGSQPLRGMSETDWTSYLDAAGYPRESKLPRNWQSPPVTALVERVPARAAAAAAPVVPVTTQGIDEPDRPGGVRF